MADEEVPAEEIAEEEVEEEEVAEMNVLDALKEVRFCVTIHSGRPIANVTRLRIGF